MLWSPDVKNWLIGKHCDAGKDWRQEKGTTEDEMVGWHCRLNGYEFEQAPWVGNGQGSLACCSPWGHKVSDTNERLNWTEFRQLYKVGTIILILHVRKQTQTRVNLSKVKKPVSGRQNFVPRQSISSQVHVCYQYCFIHLFWWDWGRGKKSVSCSVMSDSW